MATQSHVAQSAVLRPVNHAVEHAHQHGFAMLLMHFIVVCAMTCIPWLCSSAIREPLLIGYASSMIKVFRDSPVQPIGDAGIHIYSGRNEWEAFQIVLRAQGAVVRNISIRVSDLHGPHGAMIPSEHIEICRVGYVYIRQPSHRIGHQGWYPDPLIPQSAPFTLPANVGNQPLWFTVKVPKGIIAGDYRGFIELSWSADSNTSSTVKRITRRIPLRLTVWDITLPDAYHTGSAFGLWYDEVRIAHGLKAGTREEKAMREKYYWFLVERHLPPRNLPVNPASEGAERFLNDPRVYNFALPFSRNREEFARLMEYIKSKGWLQKGYLYVIDEPSPQDYPRCRETYQYIKSIEPQAKFLLTEPPTPELYGYVDIWCPNLAAFDEQHARERQALGEQVWWYTCIGPKYPYPTYLIDDDGISHRILQWMQAVYNVQGNLYWSTTCWRRWNSKLQRREPNDVWENPMAFPGGNGDGFLLYPGSKVGINGPISSIRLELIRDGTEDCEYLWLLRHKIDELAKRFDLTKHINGHQFIKQLCKPLFSDLTHFKRDPELLERLRRRAIETLLWLRKPPECIIVSKPFDGERTIYSGDGALIIGAGERTADVFINGVKASRDSQGRFAVKVNLKPGKNRIAIKVVRGDAVKQCELSIYVERDASIEELRKLCNLASERGINVRDVQAQLADIENAYVTGRYTPAVAKRVRALTNGVRRRILMLRLKKFHTAMRAPNPAGPLLYQLARKFINAGDWQRSERVLYQLETLNWREPPQQQPCKIEPVVWHGVWCYRLTNGWVQMLVMRHGGRIIDLRIFGIPLLKHNDIEAAKSEHATWIDIGGFEDAQKKLTNWTMRNWNILVEYKSPERIMLTVRTFANDEKLEFARRIIITRGSPLVRLDYRLINLTDEPQRFFWRAHIEPAIGFDRESDGGDPNWDQLMIPSKERFPYTVFAPVRYRRVITDKIMTLNEDYCGAYDSVYKAGLGLIFDRKLLRLYVWYSTMVGFYTLEPERALANSEGWTIPARGTTQWTLALAPIAIAKDVNQFVEQLRKLSAQVNEEHIGDAPANAPSISRRTEVNKYR